MEEEGALPPSRKSCNAIILSGLFSRAAEDADEEDGSLSLPPNSSLIKRTVRCCQIKSALLSVLLSPNVQGLNEASQLRSVPLLDILLEFAPILR